MNAKFIFPLIICLLMVILTSCDYPGRLRVLNCSKNDVFLVHPASLSMKSRLAAEKLELVPAGCLSSWLMGRAIYRMVIVNPASNRVDWFSYDFNAMTKNGQKPCRNELICSTSLNTELQLKYTPGDLRVCEYKSPLWLMRYDDIQPYGFPLKVHSSFTCHHTFEVENLSGKLISVVYKEESTAQFRLLDIQSGCKSPSLTVADICMNTCMSPYSDAFEIPIVDWGNKLWVRVKVLPSALKKKECLVSLQYRSPDCVLLSK